METVTLTRALELIEQGEIKDAKTALGILFAAGFRADAFNYLLFLRLVPVPFWLVNLVPALLGVRLSTFVTATAIGIVPATFIFAFFGAGLDSIITAQEAGYRACLAAGDADCRIHFEPGSVGDLPVAAQSADFVRSRFLCRRTDAVAGLEADAGDAGRYGSAVLCTGVLRGRRAGIVSVAGLSAGGGVRGVRGSGDLGDVCSGQARPAG